MALWIYFNRYEFLEQVSKTLTRKHIYKEVSRVTIEEFARMNDVKPSTVRGWISKGFIPGAHDDYIPLSARRPYTDTRAKGGTAIIRSILFACENSLGITASLYGLSEPAFCSYIDQMLNDGYISSYEEDGATYYNIAPSGAELLRNWNKKDWKGIIQTVFAGIQMALAALPIVGGLMQ